MQAIDKPYVVVLAGGEGKRLASLTRALYGSDLPKQFAVLSGERSLLQTTIERAALITSLDRVMVVVTAHHENIAREQIAMFPGVELVVQPKNLDTVPGILLPIARLLDRAWNERVVFLPSDHYIANPAPLVRALGGTNAAELADRLMLVGVTPTSAEVEYGWIVRGDRIDKSDAFDVDCFREKPNNEVAEQLWRHGALWNTFILAGKVRTFWQLARAYVPAHTKALERYAASIGGFEEHLALATAFEQMTSASFSRDVLGHARRLAVLAVDDTGWSDWGSPQRVFASLEGKSCHKRLIERIRGQDDIAAAS